MAERSTTIILFASLASFAANAADPHDHDHHHHSHDAHVHGAWELFAALDGADLSVTVKGPIVDVLGFETAPASERERQAVTDLTAFLETPEAMVSLDQRAGCRLSGPVAVNLPEGFSTETAKADEDHDHAHDNDHDHGHDIHKSDVELTYAFTCNAPKRLNAITLTGFTAFPELKTVDAVFLSDTKQSAQRLEPRSHVLRID